MCGGAFTPDHEARYVYRARAMRAGLAEGFAVFEGETPVSCAFITAQNLDSCLLGDVFTAPERRGRGYASAAVCAAARAALGKGKTPYILCEERMKGFYERLGFSVSRQPSADS